MTFLIMLAALLFGAAMARSVLLLADSTCAVAVPAVFRP
jgi:hypothetical protein